MGIPFSGGDAQVGLRIGENGLGAFQFLEGFGASDERAGHRLEPFVVLQAGILSFATPQQVGIQVLFSLGRFLGKLCAGVQVDRGQRSTCQEEGMFTFIELPVRALPLIPHALCVVIDTLATEEMGVEAGVSLFFILQALQYKLQVGFRERY